MTICIYLDDEAEELLKKKKKLDPNFNVSAFFKECLREKTSLSDDSNIFHALNDLEVKRMEIEAQEDLLKQKMAENKIKQELREKEALKQKKETEDLSLKEEQKIAEKRQNFLNNMLYFFEIEKQEAIELLDEYMENYKQEEKLDLFSFMYSKGYKEKEEQKLK